MFLSIKKSLVKCVVFFFVVLVHLTILSGCGSSSSGGNPELVMYGALHMSANSDSGATAKGPVVTGTSLLYEIDMTDGSGTLIGDTGFALSGLAFDATTGKLYGTTSSNDATLPDAIIEINLETGAGTAIGTGAGMKVNCPAFDSTGNMYAWTEDSDDPVTVDPETGIASLIGVDGVSGISSYQQGVVFDATDVLYILNGDGELFTIDTTTGEGTSVGTFTDLPEGIAHHGSIHPETGEYWGLDNTNSNTATRSLLILDLDALTLSAKTTPNIISTIDSLHMVTFAYR